MVAVHRCSLHMHQKDPVMLNDSVVEVEGTELDYDWLKFWSDTFRHTDLLQYQDSEVQMMFTNNDETTTFELTLAVGDVPDRLTDLWHSGDRFDINVENEYFDLDVATARIEQLEDGLVTIVARVLRRSFSHV